MTEKEALENHLVLCLKLLFELRNKGDNDITLDLVKLKQYVDSNVNDLAGYCYLCDFYVKGDSCTTCPLKEISCITNSRKVCDIREIVRNAYYYALKRYVIIN